MLQRALKGEKKALGPDYTLTLSTVSNFGKLYEKQGKLREVEEMYQRVLKGYEKALGPDHALTINTASILGNLYADQGKLKESKHMLLQGPPQSLGRSSKGEGGGGYV
jgi:tetratricopeptide (TPR) repeat protein